MRRLEGKVAIVTGGARGQGEADARLFAEEGAKVVVADVRDDLGKEVANEIGPAAIYARLDVAEPEQWEQTVQRALEWAGRVDVLLNNAGVAPSFAPLEEHSLEDYMRLIRTNQLGVWNGMQAVFPAMRAQRRGSIVNISSVTAWVGGTELEGGYPSTKHAVRALTKQAAHEWAPYGIRVNTILPGLISTPMSRGEDSDHSVNGIDMPRLIANIPMGRPGDPREVAYLALFLASDESSYVSGADLVIDGALTAAQRLPQKPR